MDGLPDPSCAVVLRPSHDGLHPPQQGFSVTKGAFDHTSCKGTFSVLMIRRGVLLAPHDTSPGI